MKIGGFVEQKNLTLYSIVLEDKPGSAAEILHLFGKKEINLSYITETSSPDNRAVLAFCVDTDVEDEIDKIIQEDIEFKSRAIKKREYVGIVGVYGPHFREKPAVAAKFCFTLGKAGINILGISSSISTISCVIDIQEFDRAKDALLSLFELP